MFFGVIGVLRELWDAALELVFPPRRACPICGGRSPGAGVCAGCLGLLAGYSGERVCSVCGCFTGRGGYGADLARGAGAGAVFCVDCRHGRPFELARSVGPYEGPLREAVHRLKYRGARWQARPMAGLMAEVFRCEPAFARCRGLVPVPLHPARERRRGFNQAVLLAGALGEITGVSVLERVVSRIRETPPQTSLPRHERLKNLERAFAVTAPELVTGKNITIIDDVFTTGSTVSKLSQLLRQAGAAGITVLTFATARQTGKS